MPRVEIGRQAFVFLLQMHVAKNVLCHLWSVAWCQHIVNEERGRWKLITSPKPKLCPTEPTSNCSASRRTLEDDQVSRSVHS